MKAGPRMLRIGDVEPLPAGTHLELARGAMAQRGNLLRLAASDARNAQASRARRVLRDQAEEARRLTDPLERAKTFLRRKGYTPVCQLAERRFLVGSRRFASGKEVMEFARTKGWCGS